jgi:ABC-type siderophore export system fused ATPase/permease subunit
MQRIEAFLQEEEVDDWACSLSAPVERLPLDDDTPVGFSNAVFRWPGMPSDDASPKFELGPLDVKFVPGALTIISGATASGKSAFLAALLGGLFPFVYVMPLVDDIYQN